MKPELNILGELSL